MCLSAHGYPDVSGRKNQVGLVRAANKIDQRKLDLGGTIMSAAATTFSNEAAMCPRFTTSPPTVIWPRTSRFFLKTSTTNSRNSRPARGTSLASHL
jgi:hypothetical protein